MLALAGAPLGVRLPLPRPRAGRVRRAGGGARSSAPYDDPGCLDRLADGADAVTYEFENVPVEAARACGRVPDARALELRPGPSRREGALPAARDRDRALRIARRDGRARAREVAPPRLRRQGPARRRTRRRVARRGRARRGDRRVRARAVDRRRPRARRRDRASTRSPRTSTAAGSSRVSRAPAP